MTNPSQIDRQPAPLAFIEPLTGLSYEARVNAVPNGRRCLFAEITLEGKKVFVDVPKLFESFVKGDTYAIIYPNDKRLLRRAKLPSDQEPITFFAWGRISSVCKKIFTIIPHEIVADTIAAEKGNIPAMLRLGNFYKTKGVFHPQINGYHTKAAELLRDQVEPLTGQAYGPLIRELRDDSERLLVEVKVGPESIYLYGPEFFKRIEKGERSITLHFNGNDQPTTIQLPTDKDQIQVPTDKDRFQVYRWSETSGEFNHYFALGEFPFNCQLKFFAKNYLGSLQGNLNSMQELARQCAQATQTYPVALEWYTKAAKTGDSTSVQRLGEFYEHILKNYPKAIKWHTKAVESGNLSSTLSLGSLYKKILKNYPKAIEWYTKAVSILSTEEIPKEDHLFATEALCELADGHYNENFGQYSNKEEGVKYLKMIGDLFSKLNDSELSPFDFFPNDDITFPLLNDLAICYRDGIFIIQNDSKATSTLKLITQNTDSVEPALVIKALLDLGDIYQKNKMFTEAFRSYREAVEYVGYREDPFDSEDESTKSLKAKAKARYRLANYYEKRAAKLGKEVAEGAARFRAKVAEELEPEERIAIDEAFNAAFNNSDPTAQKPADNPPLKL